MFMSESCVFHGTQTYLVGQGIEYLVSSFSLDLGDVSPYSLVRPAHSSDDGSPAQELPHLHGSLVMSALHNMSTSHTMNRRRIRTAPPSRLQTIMRSPGSRHMRRASRPPPTTLAQLSRLPRTATRPPKTL